MRFPRLKNALLCRILVYVVVLGMFAAPVVMIACLDFVPDYIKLLVVIASAIGAIIYLFKNLMILMAMDMGLAMLHCNNTARKQFALPKSFTNERMEKKVCRFGKAYPAATIQPQPSILRYKMHTPAAIYSSGIEKVVTVYHTDYLDKEVYRQIWRSATVNSTALVKKKKPFFLDKQQKRSPLNRVTVIIISALRIDPHLRMNLFDEVCQKEGDGFDVAILPCVIDLEYHACIFNSLRFPYTGFQYPVKNRGIRIIRKLIFGRKFPLKPDQHLLEPIKDMDPDQTLWEFWRDLKKELIENDREHKKRFESMNHREIIFEDDFLYVKWKERGVWLAAEQDQKRKTIAVDTIDLWDYPKSNKIAKNTVHEIQQAITTYFASRGYIVQFSPPEN